MTKEQQEQLIDMLIRFQLRLNEKGLINNHSWDFEKEAISYVNKIKKEQKVEIVKVGNR